jgi:hypothetical protein
MAKNRKPSSAATRRSKAAKQLQEWSNSPMGRLQADGASKSGQMNRRVLWLAWEWQLPRCPKIGRTMTPGLVDYCKTHGVSMDWLLCGDLKGLHRMMMKRKGRYVPPDQHERLMRKVGRLSPQDQDILRKTVDRLLAERGIGEHEPA